MTETKNEKKQTEKDRVPAGMHLMRVRVTKKVFAELDALAQQDTELQGSTVSVSSLVRKAIVEMLEIRRHTKSLGDLRRDMGV